MNTPNNPNHASPSGQDAAGSAQSDISDRIHETIAAAVAGYVSVHNPELRSILTNEEYSLVVFPPDLDFFGVWNWDKLDRELVETDGVVKIAGRFFARNLQAVDEVIQDWREVDRLEKERFYKGLPIDEDALVGPDDNE